MELFISEEARKNDFLRVPWGEVWMVPVTSLPHKFLSFVPKRIVNKPVLKGLLLAGQAGVRV